MVAFYCIYNVYAYWGLTDLGYGVIKCWWLGESQWVSIHPFLPVPSSPPLQGQQPLQELTSSWNTTAHRSLTRVCVICAFLCDPMTSGWPWPRNRPRLNGPIGCLTWSGRPRKPHWLTRKHSESQGSHEIGIVQGLIQIWGIAGRKLRLFRKTAGYSLSVVNCLPLVMYNCCTWWYWLEQPSTVLLERQMSH